MSSRLYITEHMSTKDTIRLKQWWHDFEASVMSWRSLEIEQKKGPPPPPLPFIRPFETSEGVILRDIFVVFE